MLIFLALTVVYAIGPRATVHSHPLKGMSNHHIKYTETNLGITLRLETHVFIITKINIFIAFTILHIRRIKLLTNQYSMTINAKRILQKTRINKKPKKEYEKTGGRETGKGRKERTVKKSR